jgi:predicted metal-binding protein
LKQAIMRIEVTGKLVIDYRAREWCKLPYGRYKTKTGKIRYTHPNGCPNYNKNSDCPPQAPLIEDYIDLTKKHWFVIYNFDMKNHVETLKLQPRKDKKDWTEKQARCSLYWQGRVNKQLINECVSFSHNSQKIFTLRPEARGIHVIKTVKLLDIPINTRPKDTVYKIALVGYPKNYNDPSLLDHYFPVHILG